MPLMPDIFTRAIELEDGTMIDLVAAPQAALSLPQPDAETATCEEAYGTEPPGVGWIYCGEMLWKRGLPPRKKPDGEDSD